MYENKTDIVLAHLKREGTITSWEAIKLYGATRLSAIIETLRKEDYLIETEMTKFKDRYTENGRYGIYVYKGRVDPSKPEERLIRLQKRAEKAEEKKKEEAEKKKAEAAAKKAEAKKAAKVSAASSKSKKNKKR